MVAEGKTSLLNWPSGQEGLRRAVYDVSKLLDLPGVPKRVKEVSGGIHLDAEPRMILVLGPDRQAEGERHRKRGPVVRVASTDELFSLSSAMLVGACWLPVDRHDLKRCEERREVKLSPFRQTRKVSRDLQRDGFGSQAPRSLPARNHKPCSTAD